jgi:UDP-N-acetylglucosamine 2-epimerase
LKIVTVIGARPQFIKAAPVIAAARKRRSVRHVLVHTGQHYDYTMSKVFFDELKLPAPEYYLEVGSGSHGIQTAKIMERLEPVLTKEAPDWVLVYGDTNSTLAAALAAAKMQLPVAHIEAGLRSFNKSMPEEINRVMADHVSTLLSCPTTAAIKNLRREGFTHFANNGALVEKDTVTIKNTPTADAPLVVNCGDVMFDAALLGSAVAERKSTILQTLGLQPKEYYLATVHRAANTDDEKTLGKLMAAFGQLDRPVIFPAHPRTAGRLKTFGIAVKHNVRVIEPVGYFDMLMLEKSAAAILTDSGGVQKEAFFFKVPCITLRAETEWVETVETGWNRVVGSDPDQIARAVAVVSAGKNSVFPYAKGNAAGTIVECLMQGKGNG